MKGSDAPLASTDFVELLREAMYGKAARLGQNFAEFLRPTTENVVTWGATGDLSFDTTAPKPDVFPVNSPTDTLIYVERRRPTSYNILTVLTLGAGWTGEVATLVLVVEYTVGLGTMRTTFQRRLALPAVPLSNSQPVIDVFQTPAAVLAVRALGIISTAGAAPANLAPHVAHVSCAAAPVYA